MTARRSFLARIGATAAVLGFGTASTSSAQTQPAAAGRWQPARDAKDDWLDEIPGKHRIFFDVISAQGTSEAQGFADNYLDGSKSGYGLESTDLAVVICLRHFATPFAFGDALWAKYGTVLGESLKITDPKTGQAPIVNTHRTALEALAKRGVRFAVCDMATHRFAGVVARRTAGNADTIYKDMIASVIGSSHLVTAGIIAVNRAQERGYTIAYVG
jgi:intracellular sulfur oxidation DsrE/DsrF family protein